MTDGRRRRPTFHSAPLAVAAAGLLLVACDTHPAAPQSASSPTVHLGGGPASSSPSVSAAPPSGERSSSMPSGYEPLFPFSSLAAARAWQAGYVPGGQQPWQLSADQTALEFAQHYLGFADIGKVAGHHVGVSEARVTVALVDPRGKLRPAAVIHLIRYGIGTHAPWEVVGTDDTSLTVDGPAYGAPVGTPVTVTGTISGVDESIAAEIHSLGATSEVGSYCCLPAGGNVSRWSLIVPFHARSGQVITIVVHTGGHVAPVERFAVTGVLVR